MISIIELILKLADHDIAIYLDDGKLKLNCPDNVDDAILQEIRLNKDLLIKYLSHKSLDKNELIEKVPEGSSGYLLSSSQRRLWILSQLEDANIAYHMLGVYVFEGEVDVACLEYALKELVFRHESLRTVFRENESGDLRQYIQSVEEIGFTLEREDLQRLADQEAVLKASVQASLIRPFDLSRGPLLRVTLYQLDSGKWLFSYVMHHIISDGWSMKILIREMFELYGSRLKGEVSPLLPLHIQYKDYAGWQQSQLANPSFSDHKAYWLEQFSGELPVLNLPSDYTRPALKTYNGGTIYKQLGATISKGLRSLSQESGATLYMGLLSAVTVLLSRYSGQEDIIIGSPIAGRDHRDLEDQIGFYVNTLALRLRFKGDQSYRELLEHSRQVTLGAYEHQIYPFDELVDSLQLKRDMSRNPLFDVLVELHDHNEEYKADDHFVDFKVERFNKEESIVSKFDLSFNFVDIEGQLSVVIEFNNDIYTKVTIERMSVHLQNLLSSIITSPSLPVRELCYLDVAETNQLLKVFNSTYEPSGLVGTVVGMFKQQASCRPDQIALEYNGIKMSYHDLDEQSSRLSAHLRDHYKVKKNELVGIMLNRSFEMIIAILGVLKSGGAYVPIDPKYPKSRKNYIFNDTDIGVLITETEYIFDLENYGGAIFGIDVELSGLVTPQYEIDPAIEQDNLAYVIYTSGSEGDPKGCKITHANLYNYLKWAAAFYFREEAEVHFGLYTSLSFDLTVTSIFCPLIQGGRLVIYKQDQELTDILIDIFSEGSNQNSVKLTPSHISVLKHLALSSNQIKCAIVGGEALSEEQVSVLQQINPDMVIYNEYGPTESTVGCMVKLISTGMPVTIGRPIWNTQIYILDQYEGLQPLGVVGEIYIGGVGLSRGYLNSETLTASRFINNPYQPGGRLYRTGDMGRWLAHGEVEYLGRQDNQFKVRGYRIETAEIEKALIGYDGIERCTVQVRSNLSDEKEIVAYVVGAEELTITNLRIYLSEVLPVYMIPDHYVRLETLPLTLNGKIDKNSLPSPDGFSLGTGAMYMAPRNDTEETLVKIWEEVLSKEKIGIKDNFFGVGGHSLKAIQLISRVNLQFGVKLNIQYVFNEPTIEGLAEHIDFLTHQNKQRIVGATLTQLDI